MASKLVNENRAGQNILCERYGKLYVHIHCLIESRTYINTWYIFWIFMFNVYTSIYEIQEQEGT